MKGVFLLTRLQYEFLRQYRNEHLPLLSALSAEDRAISKSCRDDHYIKQYMASDGNVFYAISPSGLAALLEFEDQLQQKAGEDAKRKADQQIQERKVDERWRKDARRSWVQFALNALFGLLGFIAGVLVEGKFDILEFFLKPFHR